MITQTKDTQNKITHERALAMLKKGNARYLQNTMINRDLREQVETTGFDGQAPHSVILSCIDSRVTSEYIFDQGIGDIFSARVAGNFVNTDILGSMEFAVVAAGVKLIVVLGHTACGAVKGTCDYFFKDPTPGFPENLVEMVEQIRPAADLEAIAQPNVDHTSANSEFIQAVSDLNVKNAMENIMKNSPALAKEIKDGDVALIGAMYDVKSGEVTWM